KLELKKLQKLKEFNWHNYEGGVVTEMGVMVVQEGEHQGSLEDIRVVLQQSISHDEMALQAQ
ncbi:hypothetical protein MKX03_000059, partial [Papaver bracteatum]